MYDIQAAESLTTCIICACNNAGPEPPSPNMETLVQLLGGEGMKVDQWEELGKALGLSEEKLEKIYVEEGNNLEKCKQYVLNVSRIRKCSVVSNLTSVVFVFFRCG